jgi:hypothetical protein
LSCPGKAFLQATSRLSLLRPPASSRPAMIAQLATDFRQLNGEHWTTAYAFSSRGTPFRVRTLLTCTAWKRKVGLHCRVECIRCQMDDAKPGLTHPLSMLDGTDGQPWRVYPFLRRLSTLSSAIDSVGQFCRCATAPGGHGPMRRRRRTAMFYDRTAYNNRWYRWLALACALLASGVLTVYLLQ